MFVTNTVKILIREYGLPITWQLLTSTSRDAKTGLRKTNTRDFAIRRALVLTEIVTRKFSYDLAYIAAGKNFTYGGEYDRGLLPIAVSTTDLPGGFSNNDFVLIDGIQYGVQNHYVNPHGVIGFNLIEIKGQEQDEL